MGIEGGLVAVGVQEKFGWAVVVEGGGIKRCQVVIYLIARLRRPSDLTLAGL